MTFPEAIKFLRSRGVEIKPLRYYEDRGRFYLVKTGGTFPPMMMLPKSVCLMARAWEKRFGADEKEA